MSRYAQISKQIRKIFYDYTPQIEPLSLDEAFLDVTGSIQLFGSAQRIGHAIQQRQRAGVVFLFTACETLDLLHQR